MKGDRRQSSNIIVIKEPVKAEKSEEHPRKMAQETNQVTGEVTPESHSQEAPAKVINKHKNKDTEGTKAPTTDEIIKRSLRNSLPTEIYNAFSPFFNGQELYNVSE